ncbi:MAG: killer suppression protein [Planctomycetes bacterium]|nr:killer suppression protein [Planctomycetota bacterium]
MNILFGNDKMAKTFNSEKALCREYGAENGKVIMKRMAFLRAAPTLAEVPHVPPTRRHELTGNRKGQFAVDLKHPFRLVFGPAEADLPLKPDGGIDLTRITTIRILSLEDYHR